MSTFSHKEDLLLLRHHVVSGKDWRELNGKK
jgi:hypothetical protein